MAQLIIVVAMDSQRGIGIRNTLPWRLPEDLAHFKRTTSGHAIIMGRKTFESIGRPLPNRRNIVITRNPAWHADGVEAVPSLAAATALAGETTAFVIGGGQVYADALPRAARLIVTEIERHFECDTFFPAIDRQAWQETARDTHRSAPSADTDGFNYAFVTYERN
jgi:dihydrofolate reductase